MKQYIRKSCLGRSKMWEILRHLDRLWFIGMVRKIENLPPLKPCNKPLTHLIYPLTAQLNRKILISFSNSNRLLLNPKPSVTFFRNSRQLPRVLDRNRWFQRISKRAYIITQWYLLAIFCARSVRASSMKSRNTKIYWNLCLTLAKMKSQANVII